MLYLYIIYLFILFLGARASEVPVTLTPASARYLFVLTCFLFFNAVMLFLPVRCVLCCNLISFDLRYQNSIVTLSTDDMPLQYPGPPAASYGVFDNHHGASSGDIYSQYNPTPPYDYYNYDNNSSLQDTTSTAVAGNITNRRKNNKKHYCQVLNVGYICDYLDHGRPQPPDPKEARRALPPPCPGYTKTRFVSITAF